MADAAVLDERVRGLVRELNADPNSRFYARRALQLLNSTFSELQVERENARSFITKVEQVRNVVDDAGATVSVQMLYEHSLLDGQEPTQKTNWQNKGFDSRCSILQHIVHDTNPNLDKTSVLDIAESLCESWWTGSLTYNENKSPLFSMMSFAQISAEIHGLVESQSMTAFHHSIQARTPVILVQILAKLLSSQSSDGSWGPKNCAETTSYAILAVVAIASLPYIQGLEMEIKHALERGHEALSLMKDGWAKPHSLWIGKLDYGSKILSEAYSLVAMKKLCAGSYDADHTRKDTTVREKVLGFSKLFSSMDHLRTQSLAVIKASILEGVFYRPFLQAKRTDIFPQTNTTGKDRYLDYIPIMWTLPNTCKQIFQSPEYLLDMMVLSMWVFLVDEYMESNVANFTADEFFLLRSSLAKIHPENETSRNISLPGFLHRSSINGNSHDGTTDSFPKPSSDRLNAAISVFFSFATAVMTYPNVLHASPTDLLDLRYETKNYLLHHLTQLEDNIRFSSQLPSQTTALSPTQDPTSTPKAFLTPRAPYSTWLHTTGTGHVSGPFAFAFLLCTLSSTVRSPLGGHNHDCFTTPRQKLIAYSMNSHLGSFCRVYNDYGSVARDAEEGNINSLNFPEFFPPGLDGEGLGREGGVEAAKKLLLEAGVYERESAMAEAEQLYQHLEEEGEEGQIIARRIQVYVGGCEQFSDMYLTRDVTNRVK